MNQAVARRRPPDSVYAIGRSTSPYHVGGCGSAGLKPVNILYRTFGSAWLAYEVLNSAPPTSDCAIRIVAERSQSRSGCAISAIAAAVATAIQPARRNPFTNR